MKDRSRSATGEGAEPTAPLIPVREARVDTLLIGAAFVGSLMITDPRGDFPLNDDWSYGLTVRRLLESGEFRPTGWTAMTLLTHTLWGALFSLGFGFSFETLRLATLVSSLVGGVAAYWLLRELRQERWLALTVSWISAFSPVSYGLSHTFMTDVPFATLVTLASICLVRSVRDDSDRALFMGTALLVAATLSRQLGVLLPIGFAAAHLLRYGVTRVSLIRATAPLGVCIGALLVFEQWLSALGRTPFMYTHRNTTAFASLGSPGALLAVARNGYLQFLFLGLFLLPVLTLVGMGLLRTRGRTGWFCLLISVIAAVGGLAGLADDHLMPDPIQIRSNMLQEWGLGPILLHDTFILGINRPPGLAPRFWLGVTALSVVGAALLLMTLLLHGSAVARKARAGPLDWIESSAAGLVLGALAYLSPLLLTGAFDRYLIPVVVPLAAGLVALAGSAAMRMARSFVPLVPALGLSLAYAVYAVCGTRDFMTWNRARWHATTDLLNSSQAGVGDIDGGFEFNGWYAYDPSYRIDPALSPWWVTRDTFRIGLGSMPGYSTVREYPVSLWMPPHTGKVVVLERIEARRDRNITR